MIAQEYRANSFYKSRAARLVAGNVTNAVFAAAICDIVKQPPPLRCIGKRDAQLNCGCRHRRTVKQLPPLTVVADIMRCNIRQARPVNQLSPSTFAHCKKLSSFTVAIAIDIGDTVKQLSFPTVAADIVRCNIDKCNAQLNCRRRHLRTVKNCRCSRRHRHRSLQHR